MKTSERMREAPARKPRRRKLNPQTHPPAPKPEKKGRVLPKLRQKGNVIFIVHPDAHKYRISYRMVFTVLLIFLGAMGSALTYAHIANTQQQLTRAMGRLTSQQETNFAARERLRDRYNRYEIEARAIELGMNHPDPAQIIYIYVPPHDHVVLNDNEGAIPSQNYFLQEIRDFFAGIRSRIFGGRNERT